MIKFFDLKVKDRLIRKKILKKINYNLLSGSLLLGNEVSNFEKKCCKFLKSKFSMGVSSGSSALFLALKSLGIGKGDEVITTPLTWIITINAISSTGAKPIFADVGEDFNIDPYSIKKLINKKTKAILPMHYAGHVCDMVKIKKIANSHGLFLIEDAAQAFGASLNGKKAGTFSDVGAFSMNPMKVLNGYGENGLVVTNSKKLIKKLTMMRHAGTISNYKKKITNKCYYISLNHKMDSINAAALNVSFENFSKKLKKLNQIANYYDKNLDKRIIKQKLHKGEVHGRYAYPIVFYNKNRNTIMNSLEKDGIQTRIFHSPLAHQTPVYKQNTNRKFNTAEFLEKNSLVIPLHHNLTNNEVKKIVKKINRFF